MHNVTINKQTEELVAWEIYTGIDTFINRVSASEPKKFAEICHMLFTAGVKYYIVPVSNLSI